MKYFEHIVGFLFDSTILKSLDNDDLKNSYITLKSTFSHGSLSYVDLDDLFLELKILKMTLPNEIMPVIEILNFVKNAYCYPNVAIAYRILLKLLKNVAIAYRILLSKYCNLLGYFVEGNVESNLIQFYFD